jgi:hypothetical protein
MMETAFMPCIRKTTFVTTLFSHFLLKKLDKMNLNSQESNRIYLYNLVGESMHESLIKEFSKPTLAEIKKSKLSDYQGRNIDVVF